MQSLDPDHILTESAPSQQTVTSKAVNSSVPDWPLLGWIYNSCLCFKTYHYSIFAWVMSVSADLCLSTFFFSQTGFTLQKMEIAMTGFVMLNFEKFTYSFKEKFDILGNTAYYLFSCQELYRKIDMTLM